MDKISILQVFNQYLEAGGEEEWVNQLNQLGGNSYDIGELRFHSSAWIGRGAPSVWEKAKLLWSNPDSAMELDKKVRNIRPDCLLFHNLLPVGSFSLYREARALGLPVVQYIHNFRPFSPSGTLWTNTHLNPAALRGNPLPEILSGITGGAFYRNALIAFYQHRFRAKYLETITHWIAVSEFMRDQFIQAGIPEHKITTLRHCWKSTPKPNRTPEKSHYLFLGRLVREKGIHTLIDSWQILEKRLGSSCPKLIIAGTGPESAPIHARLKHLNHADCVGFISGNLKKELLESCKAVIAPSLWWEPLGLIVHEAYSASRPVLAAISGGLTETVVQGSTGLLHEAGNANQLADDVEHMESIGSSGRNSMGNAGRDWLLKHASPEEWRENFISILETALQANSTGNSEAHIQPHA